MLLLLTIALVIVGAVSLLIGFVQDQMFPIYLSIACSLLAAVVLLVFSRLSRTRVEPRAAVATGPADDTAAIPRVEAPAPTVSTVASSGDDDFPIADYDELRVGEIMPLLPELDLDELDMVRRREEATRNRATVLRRVDELEDELRAGTAVEAPSAFAADAADDEGFDDRADDRADGVFPIEDYDDLRVSEILPLLDELEADELEDVADRERAGAGRSTVLSRIDDLLAERTGAAPAAAAPAKKAPAKRSTAKKAAAKKAPAKRSTTTKSAAKKSAAKKSAAKKAPAKRSTTKKAAAKKAPAKRSGGAQ